MVGSCQPTHAALAGPAPGRQIEQVHRRGHCVAQRAAAHHDQHAAESRRGVMHARHRRWTVDRPQAPVQRTGRQHENRRVDGAVDVAANNDDVRANASGTVREKQRENI